MRRLNKYITDAGYCSRREADNYIAQGRVTVNGCVAALGTMVGDMDCVEVDGEKIGRRKRMPVYIACHKPVGITCTSERSDKTNIVDFLGYKERIFPVGRLDKDSEGLILLTNDGDIVNKILRAGNNNPKEYIVTVDKPITQEFLDKMSGGVRILGVTTKPCRVFRKKETTFVIHLTQGLNRQIRRMCQVLGYKVMRLKRIKVLNISLGGLEPGRWRHLTTEEAREMHVLLARSSGTEEASNERKAQKPKPRQGHNAYGNRKGPQTNTKVGFSTQRADKKNGGHSISSEKSAKTYETSATGVKGRSAKSKPPGKPAGRQSADKSPGHSGSLHKKSPKR